MVFKALFSQVCLDTVCSLWLSRNGNVFLVILQAFALWSISSPGAATALLEAARAASAATGLWAGEAAAPSREHRQSGNSTQEGPCSQGPGGAEAPQQWQTG